MAIEVFNRYEYKYMMDTDTYQKISERLLEFMKFDAYNENGEPYTISNIYYDTPDDRLIRASLSKPKYKEKFRIRSYGVPSEGEKVFLEIKKKFNGLVNKRRTSMLPKEGYEFCENKKAPELQEYMNPQVVKEIEYFVNRYELMPKVYVAYDRVAYFELDNPDLRISFDTNIRTRRTDLHLEDGDYGELILSDEMWLMEVKVSKNMPLWLSEILADLKLKRSSFSKYGTEFRKYIMSEPQTERQALRSAGAAARLNHGKTAGVYA